MKYYERKTKKITIIIDIFTISRIIFVILKVGNFKIQL